MLKYIREKFLNYFANKNHLILESASLLPKNDKSLLFVNSGMAPMKAYFLNEETPPSKLIATAQKCLRVGGKHNDLADIGYSKRHHTFFEMLGNFSFGGYFKKEAIDYAWDFLLNELNLDSKKLYITVHPSDEEAKRFWSQYVDESRITLLENNLWTMGEIGPWGYCSEIFYDLEEGEGNLEEGDRYLEIWNLVFTQFCFDGKKNFTLDYPCIDTGIGLERIASILENKTDNYEIDFFKSQLKYLNSIKHSMHTKIFLDHLRSVSFIIMENIIPSASQEGYVLRRLMRRMLRSFYNLNCKDLASTIQSILNNWSSVYEFEIDKIVQVIEKESHLFNNTINEALKKFNEKFKDGFLSAADMFLLHDTYGLTVDIVNDLVKEKKGKVDFAGFEKIMEESREKNKKKVLFLDFPETEFISQVSSKGKLLGVHDNKYLIFDCTSFYAEGGGQVGDTGVVWSNNFKAKIIDTKKFNKVYCHEFQLLEGEIHVGDIVQQQVDCLRRRKIEAHHSCSHLLQYALEKLYGDGVKQMGSLVSAEKFREDFTFPADNADLFKIEEEINHLIFEETESEEMYMSLTEARAMGAKAFFDYEDTVRVMKIGPSLELCGGTHVKNTKDIIGCKLLKVSSVKSGVKRFEGIAGYAYIEYLKAKEVLTEEICDLLKCSNDNLINSLKKAMQTRIPTILKYKGEIKNVHFGLIHGNDDDSLEQLMMQYNLNICCLYVEKETKCNIKIKSDLDYVNAKDLVNAVSYLISSKGGGGNAFFAQTGGKKQDNLQKIYETLFELISQLVLKI